MAIEFVVDDATNRVEVRGDLTIYEADEAFDALTGLLTGGRPALILSLAGVGEFDSAGLQLLVALARECQGRRLDLTVEAAGEAVRGVLNRFGLPTEGRFTVPPVEAA